MNDAPLKMAEEIEVGGEAADSTATLCIYADDIDLQAISSALRASPTDAHRRGEVVGRRPPASVGLWSLEAPRHLKFSEKLQYLVHETISDAEVWERLVADHRIELRCAIFLHSWNEGFDVPADLMAQIAQRHWQFGLSLYSAEGNEIVDAFLRKGYKPNKVTLPDNK